MRNIIKLNGVLLLGVTLALTNSGCFKKAATAAAATDTATTTPTATPNQVTVPANSSAIFGHSFITACEGVPGLYQNAIYTFNNDNSTGAMISMHYSDSNCLTPQFMYSAPLLSISLGTIDSTTGQFTFNFTPYDTTVTPLSNAGATFLNNQGLVVNNVTVHGLCAYQSWQNGVSIDLATSELLTCQGNERLAAAVATYGTLWLTGVAGSLHLVQDARIGGGYCNGNDELTSDKRCTTAGTQTQDNATEVAEN